MAYDTPAHPGPSTVETLLEALRSGAAQVPRARLRAFPTGFEPLDRVLEGGFRAQDLVLVGGMPGVGKTAVTLQWARHMAMQGRRALYACYEHDESTLLGRLLLLELGEGDEADPVGLVKLRTLVHEFTNAARPLDDLLVESEALQRAYRRLEQYADRLLLLRASGAHTGIDQLDALAREADGDRELAIFVDYLQKVAVTPEPPTDAEKVTRIAEGLKELALAREAPVVAVVAADRSSLFERRLRLHHLRGSSALAYEADVVLMLNDKYRAVSKVHLAYDPVRAETFRDLVVFSLEKNRSGPTFVDLEFRKDFEHYRLDPVGAHVPERLIDDRFHTE